jgi:hypothetical protein
MATAAIDALRMIQRELAGSKVEKIPAGWKTQMQWAKDSGMSFSHTGSLLLAGVRAKTWERRRFHIDMGDTAARAVFHYRQKPK